MTACCNENNADKLITKKTDSISSNDKKTYNHDELKAILIDSLTRHKANDSCEIYLDNCVLKIGNFLKNKKTYAFIVIKEFKFLFFESISNKWKLINETQFDNDYAGYKIADINGDGCLDFMLKDNYVYSNVCYKVIVQDCKQNTLKYISDFEGLMNPFFDDNTKLVNSFLFTNHGEIKKETYSFSGDSLSLVERVTLDGIGVEDIDNNKFVIKHFVNSNKKTKLIKTLTLKNFDKATSIFDNLLFDYFVDNNCKRKLYSSKGWVQLETK